MKSPTFEGGECEIEMFCAHHADNLLFAKSTVFPVPTVVVYNNSNNCTVHNVGSSSNSRDT
jgi:hypothetical protein